MSDLMKVFLQSEDEDISDIAAEIDMRLAAARRTAKAKLRAIARAVKDGGDTERAIAEAENAAIRLAGLLAIAQLIQGQ